MYIFIYIHTYIYIYIHIYEHNNNIHIIFRQRKLLDLVLIWYFKFHTGSAAFISQKKSCLLFFPFFFWLMIAAKMFSRNFICFKTLSHSMLSTTVMLTIILIQVDTRHIHSCIYIYNI